MGGGAGAGPGLRLELKLGPTLGPRLGSRLGSRLGWGDGVGPGLGLGLSQAFCGIQIGFKTASCRTIGAWQGYTAASALSRMQPGEGWLT